MECVGKVTVGDMSGNGGPTDHVILSWWNQQRGIPTPVTPEMAHAYTRQVVLAEAIARFDAHLARLLTPTEGG
jgi:hypothetical protein